MSSILRRNLVEASFTTIQVPSGTSPTASGPNDILTLVAGSGISITGDSSTDTITIAATGGLAWGLTGNSGTTAGTNFLGTTDSVALVLKTNATEAMRITAAQLVGIAVAAPSVTLHVAGVATTTPAPTNFSVSQLAEQSNTASSGSGTPTYGPSDSSNAATVTATQNSGSGNYFADGSTSITYSVYAVILFGGVYYYRGTPATANFTDDNTSQSFTVDLAWNSVSGATSYVISASGSANTGNPNWIENVGNVTSFNDDGARSSVDSVSNWDTIAYPYDAGGTAPTAPSGTAVMTLVNSGFGNKGPANGTTYSYDIDTAVQISGVWYCSGSPINVSQTDPNDSSFFDWQVDSYTLNGGSETDVIVRRTTDGGGTYDYFFLGSLTTSFTDGTYTNDTTAAARWGQTYGGPPATVTRQYKTYGYGTSPTNGTVWYSSSFNSYSVVANNDVNGYVITHSITHGSRGNTRILGDFLAVGDYSQYYDTSATSFVEGGVSIWNPGAIVTPTHYGIQATGQTRYWRLYAQKTSPITYYSSSYLQGSSTLPNDSAYYTFNFSWTAGTGSTNTRILESTDGTTYSIGQLQGGTSIVRELNAPAFASGTTVTPNSIDDSAIIGQNSSQLSTSAGQIVARTTTANTGLAQFELQKSDGTVMNRWYASAGDSNGNFWTLGSKFSFFNNSAGNYADIGLTATALNKTNNSSYEFTINASSTSNGFKFSPGSGGQPKVWIGSVGTNYGGALQLVNVTNVKNLFLRTFSSQTENIIEATNTASSFLFRVNSSGDVTIGSFSSANAGRLRLVGGNSTTAGIIMESGTLTSSLFTGALEFNTNNFYMTHDSTRRHPIASDNNPIGMQVFS